MFSSPGVSDYVLAMPTQLLREKANMFVNEKCLENSYEAVAHHWYVTHSSKHVGMMCVSREVVWYA